MIYKFRFEVTNDQNDHCFHARSEESGNFWWAFTAFMNYILGYAAKSGLYRLQHKEDPIKKMGFLFQCSYCKEGISVGEPHRTYTLQPLTYIHEHCYKKL